MLPCNKGFSKFLTLIISISTSVWAYNRYSCLRLVCNGEIPNISCAIEDLQIYLRNINSYANPWNPVKTLARRVFVLTEVCLGEFATRLTGSSDLYEHSGRKPFASVNFITCHDGFTLHDLVSYNDKHNDANGENNSDGESHNNSWNCGAEGPDGGR